MASIGELLKIEREKKGLSLKQVEKETKIRESLLQAVEQNAWEAFSSRIYITGVIRNYARYLGIDSSRLIALFRRDYEKKDDVSFKKRVPIAYLTSETKKTVIFGIVLLCLLFIFYFAYQLSQFFSSPEIVITSPHQTRLRGVDQVRIVGQTEKESSVIIYGEKVYPNKEGVFEYTFPLKDGKNELIIEVVGPNGRKSVLKKEYIKE